MDNKNNINLDNLSNKDVANENQHIKLENSNENMSRDTQKDTALNNPTVSKDLKTDSNVPFVETPAKVLSSMYFSRFAIILSNLSLVCVILSFASAITVIISWLIWIVGLSLIIVTLGIILLVFPGYWDGLMNSSQTLSDVSAFLIKFWPIISGLGVISAVVSIVLLACDKTRNHTARIVFSSVVLALIVIAIIVLLLEGGRA